MMPYFSVTSLWNVPVRVRNAQPRCRTGSGHGTRSLIQMLATTRLASPTLSNQMSRAPPSDAHALPVRHAERSPPRPSPAL